ncbi:MAG: pyridoxal phosphate-dependent aminotransferase [Candidatus Hodarchaeales archaeon]
MQYDKFIDPSYLEVPLSGIRLVNQWPSELPESELIRLNIGQPDIPTPKFVIDAAVKAVQTGKTRYTNFMGEINLRKEICKYLERTDNLTYKPDEILITNGGQSAIFSIMQSILSPNDNIIVPFPCYPPYLNAIKYKRANIIPLITTIENNFDIPIDELKAILEKLKVKAILLISPTNPTGRVIPRKTLKTIVELASEYNFLIISDEIYNRIVFNENIYFSPATMAKDRTIIIQSFSKMLSMTGFRIGFIAAPKPLIDIIKIVHHSMNICANSIAQYSILEILQHQSELDKTINYIKNLYKKRAKLAISILNKKRDYLNYVEPQGAFYILPQFKSENMLDFAKWLKLKYGVLTVPGVFFSDSSIQNYSSYLRICFTANDSTLKDGLDRICEAIEKYLET